MVKRGREIIRWMNGQREVKVKRECYIVVN
jgi:hypothetical protein